MENQPSDLKAILFKPLSRDVSSSLNPWIPRSVAVIAIVVVAVVLLPQLNRAGCGCAGPQTHCAANEHQILNVLFDYAHQHEGNLPGSLHQIVPSAQLETRAKDNFFHCPVGAGAYLYVGHGINIATAPPDTVVLYEPPDNHKGSKGKGTMNVGYTSGNVESLSQPQADKIIAELKAGHNPPRPEMIK